MLLAFVLGKINVFAQLSNPNGTGLPMYGSQNAIILNIFMVLILPIIFFLTLIVGIVVFIRRKKRKNVEKDS